ncbi:MAG: FAD-dependent oxidoreductase [Chloroflexi bacterium]|nr:FAD-dependent oxidoreductase [Chloroflexota bacterium]
MNEAINTADVVICGAGIAGVALAYQLAVQHGVKNVVLVDERPPLTLTSDKSTECYRNWWPGPGDEMVRLMNRSIDLLEQLAEVSDNYFHLNRRGYVYLTADPAQGQLFHETSLEIANLGAGELRIHHGRPSDPTYAPIHAHGYDPALTGADLVLDPAKIQAIFPFVTADTVAMLHPRRCGWLSAQQLGMYLLEQVKQAGARLVVGRVMGVQTAEGRVSAVQIQSDTQTHTIHTPMFVNAAGPLLAEVGRLLGAEIPVYNELHGKVAFEDPLGIVPRHAPLMIWNDPVNLFWTEEEREDLAASEETRWLLETFPAGVHFRPEGGEGAQTLLAIWTYHVQPQPFVWPPRFEPEYAELVVRGLARMVPGLAVYAERMGKPWVDGGYYCKTRENRPLACLFSHTAGAYVLGAFSGYGIMAAMAASELLAAQMVGAAVPDYAPAFDLRRYNDPTYQQLLENWDSLAGQL